MENFAQNQRGPKRSKKSRFRVRLKISSENEIFERATHRGPIFFCGEFETSRLKFSSEIKIFNRDWQFRARLKFLIFGPSGQRNRPNRRRTKYREHACQKIRPWKRLELYFPWTVLTRCPSFPCFFLRQGKPPKKTRIVYPYRTPEIPGKEGKIAEKNKESSQGEKTRNSKH